MTRLNRRNGNVYTRETSAFPARRASLRYVSIVMFFHRIGSQNGVRCQKCESPIRTSSFRQIASRRTCSPEFDEPANGTKIVQSRKQAPETKREEKRKISPIVPAMVIIIIAAWTIAIHVPSAMAGPVSQQAKSDVRVQGGEDPDGL